MSNKKLFSLCLIVQSYHIYNGNLLHKKPHLYVYDKSNFLVTFLWLICKWFIALQKKPKKIYAGFYSYNYVCTCNLSLFIASFWNSATFAIWLKLVVLFMIFANLNSSFMILWYEGNNEVYIMIFIKFKFEIITS